MYTVFRMLFVAIFIILFLLVPWILTSFLYFYHTYVR